MTVKRLLLGALTILAIVFVLGDLVSSWSQPRFSSRLELYETDLLLQASEWQGDGEGETARKALAGVDPLKTALDQYQKTREAAQNRSRLQKPDSNSLPNLRFFKLPPPQTSSCLNKNYWWMSWIYESDCCSRSKTK